MIRFLPKATPLSLSVVVTDVMVTEPVRVRGGGGYGNFLPSLYRSVIFGTDKVNESKIIIKNVMLTTKFANYILWLLCDYLKTEIVNLSLLAILLNHQNIAYVNCRFVA